MIYKIWGKQRKKGFEKKTLGQGFGDKKKFKGPPPPVRKKCRTRGGFSSENMLSPEIAKIPQNFSRLRRDFSTVFWYIFRVYNRESLNHLMSDSELRKFAARGTDMVLEVEPGTRLIAQFCCAITL